MSLSHEHLSEIVLHYNIEEWKWEIHVQFPVSHTDVLKLLPTKENIYSG